MHFLAQNFAIALIIGAEVFAIAALWPLSDWAVRTRRWWPLAGSVLTIAACLSPNAHLILHQGLPDAPVARVVAWILLALLVVFPDAVCIASAQSLARAGLPARWARATALALAGVAVLVAPFGTIVAGCGLVGACY
jgi:hypothetical protein